MASIEGVLVKQITFVFVSIHFVVAAHAYGVFQSIDYPGAANTIAAGIDGNKIVGVYYDSGPTQHGFIYDGTSFATLDYPGSISTALLDIDGNRIVGAYRDELGNFRGFSYENGVFQTINPPGTSNLFENGSDARGASGSITVGEYNSDGGGAALSHGFIFDGSTYTTFDNPSGISSRAEDVDGKHIVGEYQTGDSREHGYYYDGNNFATIDFPSAGSLGSTVSGISGNKIVGYFYPPSFFANGFIYEDGVYSVFNVPSSLGRETEILGVSGNTIVGLYNDSQFHNHGFVATIPEPSASVLAAWLFVLLSNRSRGRSRGA